MLHNHIANTDNSAISGVLIRSSDLNKLKSSRKARGFARPMKDIVR